MSMDKKIIIVKKDGKEEFYGKLKNIAETLPADKYIRYVSAYSPFRCE